MDDFKRQDLKTHEDWKAEKKLKVSIMETNLTP